MDPKDQKMFDKRGQKDQYPTKIMGLILSSVSNNKFLRVILDDKLTWKNHID